ncbi:hypothetical protein N6A11_000700 [Klebsiella oxytoca]|nr:hypothetical protein [Klebsiella oxytoca]
MKPTYEELEAKCAALASENAGLREYRPQPSGAAMMEALDAFYEYHEDVPERGMTAAFEILCCKRPATPATDAFLAEVRAQGVEMAAKSEQFSAWVQQGLRSFAIGVRQGDDQ